MTTPDLILRKAAAPAEAKPGASPAFSRADDAPFESAMDRALGLEAGRKLRDVQHEPADNVVQLSNRTAQQKLIRTEGIAAPESDEAASNEIPENGAAETSEADGETPSNIVLFPNPSVIIPFPLALAGGRAEPGAADAHVSRGSEQVKAPMESGGASSTEGPTASNILPLIATASGDKSAPNAQPSSTRADHEGIEVSKLGLTMVEAESSESAVTRKPPAEPSVSPDPQTSLGSEMTAMQRDETTDAHPPVPARFLGTPPPEVGHPEGGAVAEPELTQLPPSKSAAVDSAQTAGGNTPWEPAGSRGKEVETSINVVIPQEALAHGGSAKTAGIATAKHETGMTLSEHSQQGEALDERVTGALKGSAEAEHYDAENGSESSSHFSARSSDATDWQASRPVNNSDRPAADVDTLPAVDHVETVDRISRLVVREAALVRQYHSDSMAVVLRPDTETELFVHLSQRNGQIEAVVRCERGDAQTLGALWPQLQESLASQKVRLAPLQESPTNSSNYNSSASPGSNGHDHGNGFSRQTPGRQSMDEWPAPASSDGGLSRSRTRGESGHRRVTTSRPGWETWA